MAEQNWLIRGVLQIKLRYCEDFGFDPFLRVMLFTTIFFTFLIHSLRYAFLFSATIDFSDLYFFSLFVDKYNYFSN